MASTSSAVEKTVEAGVYTAIGEVSIVRERFEAPFIAAGAGKDNHHLQLSLLPSPQASLACYEDVWSPHRFERMGELFLFPAHTRLRTRSACQLQQSLVCELAPQRVQDWFDADLEWTDDRLVGSLDIADHDVRRLMNAIIAELARPGFAREAMVELLTAQICIVLARHFQDIDLDRGTGGLAPWRMRLIDDCLEADPGASIASLAGQCGISARHLARAFRTSTGRSLGDYIAGHRLAVARRLLASGASVKHTAFATGFAAPTNFATAFRRATGMTPRQYRDQRALQ